MVKKLSVIVPTYNGARVLSRCLRSLVVQDTTFSWEILVMDDGSTDETPAVAGRFAAAHPALVRYYRLLHRGLPATKNAGIALARGEILLFLDDDIVIPGGLLQRLVDYMEDGGLDVVGVLDLPMEGDTYLARCLRYMENFSRTVLEKGVLDVKAAAAYRRKCFEHVGLFDESRTYYRAEDAEFNRRCRNAGLKVELAPQLQVYHRADDLVGFVRKSLLGLRHMDVPGGFRYFRCHFSLAVLVSMVLWVVVALHHFTAALLLLGAGFLSALLLGTCIARSAGVSLGYVPGIVAVGAVRIFFILMGGIRYMFYAVVVKGGRCMRVNAGGDGG